MATAPKQTTPVADTPAPVEVLAADTTAADTPTAPVDEAVAQGDVGFDLPDDVKSLIGRMVAEHGVATKAVFYTFGDYLRTMGPAVPVTAEAGARHQREFYNAVISILKDTGALYRIRLGVLLRIFSLYADSAFSADLIGRFWSGDQANQMLKLIVYLIEVAPVDTRAQVVKMLRIDDATRGLLNEAQLNNLRGFLRIGG